VLNRFLPRARWPGAARVVGVDSPRDTRGRRTPRPHTITKLGTRVTRASYTRGDGPELASQESGAGPRRPEAEHCSTRGCAARARALPTPAHRAVCTLSRVLRVIYFYRIVLCVCTPPYQLYHVRVRV
jgi:hypothetical protein